MRTLGLVVTSSLRNLNTWPRPPSLCLESTARASTRLTMSVRLAPACRESSRYGSLGVLSLTGICDPIEAVFVNTRDMQLPLPLMSPVSTYLNGLASAMCFTSSAKAPKARSLADSPAAMVSPKRPMAAASRNTFPFNRPSVIEWGFPVLITRMAASTVVGKCSDFAKLLKVPIERIPTGCLLSASLRTTQPMEPSPPATMTIAVGPTSFSMSILGSNSTIRLLAKALRSLASISGVIEPAFELKISRLVARLGLLLALRVRGAIDLSYFLPNTRLNAGAQGELRINRIQRAQANEWRPLTVDRF